MTTTPAHPLNGSALHRPEIRLEAVPAPRPAPPAPARVVEPADVVDITTPEPLRGAYVSVLKPAFDRAVALVLIIVLAPLMALAAIAVRISMGSPVLFRQRRVGLGGRTFDVLKFRTMDHDRRQGQRRTSSRPNASDRRLVHKTDADPRHTPVGRFLRKWSLDELPQLFNVLNGDMSLVGPRPELVDVVGKYPAHVHDRHRVKPGITGLWQVGARGDGLMFENPELDLEYVERQSFALDLQILFRTPFAALGSSRGE